ncbi:MAG TPA: hypothetical protein GXX25_07810 [Desulfotomaculum sp.]|uniref:hypothetical protein n=1 Tax=Desulfofundulus thermobenzoicus TaxID=29376 RepID=UPI001753EA1E|nr:hypothetical protein [Desulfofundulus thermobenzoicus]HHW43698.1 hypothetical protein [Desulfotomaculum sp.]
MFFEHWWQGLVFGVVTSVAMLVIANFLGTMWQKYEDVPEKPASHGCDAHGHH